ncbi:MAG TPA: phosphatase PAP2 family protein [Candidatus Magasanikbacteria bacterium]|nr:phosphatase PAP2 family protein [Candidatus Magasanikbacteria bacterium]
MNFLRQLDYRLMRLINGWAKHYKLLDYFGVFCAVYLIWIMVALALSLFFYIPKNINRLKYLFVLLASSVGAYLISAVFGFIYGRARPFVGFNGLNQLIATSFSHKSFPSSHSTLAFALAFSVLFFNRPLGILMLILAILVAWGRVFVGVHYPMDILGGAILGGLVSLVVYRLLV